MRHLLFPALAAALFTVPAFAQTKMTWVSAPVFIGQATKPDGSKHVTYLAAIQSEQPDANGSYELFVQTKPYYQESFADRKAIHVRALCNASGDNSCVIGQPGWQEILQTLTFVKQ
jgi:hypothetical protein